MSRSDRRAAELAGRTIVVVGASSGFGRGAALELGRLGAAVVVAARRGDALADVVAEIERNGGRTLAVVTDVSDAAAVEALADAAVARFGGIDVWVNNVGIGTLGIAVGTIMPWAVDTPWWTHAANDTGRTPRMAQLDDPRVVVEAIVSVCVHPVEAQKVGWKARIAKFAGLHTESGT